VFSMFLQTSWRRELEFRANFIAQIAQSIVWVVMFILILNVIFVHSTTIAGWNRGSAYVLSATCMMMSSVSYTFFGNNLIELSEQIRRGTLDFDLLKPMDLQFLISLRRVVFWEAGAGFAGILVLVFGAARSGSEITPSGIAAYCILFACSCGLFYSLNLLMMTLSVWFIKVENLWVLGETAVSFVRYPMEVFGSALRKLFIFFLPVAFLSWVPAKALLGTCPFWLGALSIVWTAVALVVSRRFFLASLRWYGSASS